MSTRANDGHIDLNPNWQSPGETQYTKKTPSQEGFVTFFCQTISLMDDEHLSQALEQISHDDLAQLLSLAQHEKWNRDKKFARESNKKEAHALLGPLEMDCWNEPE